MRTFSKLLKVVSTAEGWVAVIALCTMVATNFWEIIQRNLWDASWVWIQELTTVLFTWFVFMGFAKITHSKADIYITMFAEKFPKGVQTLLTVLINGVIIAYNVCFLKNAWQLAQQQMRLHLGTVVLGIPLVIQTSATMICAVTMLLVCVEDLWKMLPTRDGLPGAPNTGTKEE